MEELEPQKGSLPMLGEILARTIALRDRTQLAHWNATGPEFVGLHDLFGEQYEDLATGADELAERLRQLGQRVQLIANPSQPQSDKPSEMIRELADENAAIEALCNVAAAAYSSGATADAASVDLVSRRAAASAKATWKLRSLLSTNDTAQTTIVAPAFWVPMAEDFGSQIWGQTIEKGGHVDSDGTEYRRVSDMGLMLLDPTSLFKAGIRAHRWLKRVPTGRFRTRKDGKPGAPIYRYFYKVQHGGGVHNAADFQAGASFAHGDGHFTIHGVGANGKLQVTHSSQPDKKLSMSHDDLHNKLIHEHAQAYVEHHEKLKRQHKEALESGNHTAAAKLRQEAAKIGYLPIHEGEIPTPGAKATAKSNTKATAKPTAPPAPAAEKKTAAAKEPTAKEPAAAPTSAAATAAAPKPGKFSVGGNMHPENALEHIAKNHPDEHVRLEAEAMKDRLKSGDAQTRRGLGEMDGKSLLSRLEHAGRVRKALKDVKDKHGDRVHADVDKMVREQGVPPDAALPRVLAQHAKASGDAIKEARLGRHPDGRVMTRDEQIKALNEAHAAGGGSGDKFKAHPTDPERILDHSTSDDHPMQMVSAEGAQRRERMILEQGRAFNESALTSELTRLAGGKKLDSPFKVQQLADGTWSVTTPVHDEVSGTGRSRDAAIIDALSQARGMTTEAKPEEKATTGTNRDAIERFNKGYRDHQAAQKGRHPDGRVMTRDEQIKALNDSSRMMSTSSYNQDPYEAHPTDPTMILGDTKYGSGRRESFVAAEHSAKPEHYIKSSGGKHTPYMKTPQGMKVRTGPDFDTHEAAQAHMEKVKADQKAGKPIQNQADVEQGAMAPSAPAASSATADEAVDWSGGGKGISKEELAASEAQRQSKIPKTKVEHSLDAGSSNVSGIAWTPHPPDANKPGKGTMRVRFKGGDSYDYQDVHHDLYEAVRRGDVGGSHGKTLNALVKDKHAVKRVAEGTRGATPINTETTEEQDKKQRVKARAEADAAKAAAGAEPAPTSAVHTYGVRRPIELGSVPIGSQARGEHPDFPHGTVSYKHELSEATRNHYGLKKIPSAEEKSAIADKVHELATSPRGKAMLDALRERGNAAGAREWLKSKAQSILDEAGPNGPHVSAEEIGDIVRTKLDAGGASDASGTKEEPNLVPALEESVKAAKPSEDAETGFKRATDASFDKHNVPAERRESLAAEAKKLKINPHELDGFVLNRIQKDATAGKAAAIRDGIDHTEDWTAGARAAERNASRRFGAATQSMQGVDVAESPYHQGMQQFWNDIANGKDFDQSYDKHEKSWRDYAVENNKKVDAAPKRRGANDPYQGVSTMAHRWVNPDKAASEREIVKRQHDDIKQGFVPHEHGQGVKSKYAGRKSLGGEPASSAPEAKEPEVKPAEAARSPAHKELMDLAKDHPNQRVRENARGNLDALEKNPELHDTVSKWAPGEVTKRLEDHVARLDALSAKNAAERAANPLHPDGQRFRDAYAKHLERINKFTPTDAMETAEKMVRGIGKHDANTDSAAMRATSKELGVKHTHSELADFVTGGQASKDRAAAKARDAEEKAKAKISPQESLQRAREVRANAALDKSVRHDGVVKTRRKMVEDLHAQGYKVADEVHPNDAKGSLKGTYRAQLENSFYNLSPTEAAHMRSLRGHDTAKASAASEAAAEAAASPAKPDEVKPEIKPAAGAAALHEMTAKQAQAHITNQLRAEYPDADSDAISDTAKSVFDSAHAGWKAALHKHVEGGGKLRREVLDSLHEHEGSPNGLSQSMADWSRRDHDFMPDGYLNPYARKYNNDSEAQRRSDRRAAGAASKPEDKVDWSGGAPAKKATPVAATAAPEPKTEPKTSPESKVPTSAPTATAATAEDHLSEAAKTYGLTDKDVESIAKGGYHAKAREFAAAGDQAKAKEHVRLAVKDHLTRDRKRDMSPSGAERFMKEREASTKPKEPKPAKASKAESKVADLANKLAPKPPEAPKPSGVLATEPTPKSSPTVHAGSSVHHGDIEYHVHSIDNGDDGDDPTHIEPDGRIKPYASESSAENDAVPHAKVDIVDHGKSALTKRPAYGNFNSNTRVPQHLLDEGHTIPVSHLQRLVDSGKARIESAAEKNARLAKMTPDDLTTHRLDDMGMEIGGGINDHGAGHIDPEHRFLHEGAVLHNHATGERHDIKSVGPDGSVKMQTRLENGHTFGGASKDVQDRIIARNALKGDKSQTVSKKEMEDYIANNKHVLSLRGESGETSQSDDTFRDLAKRVQADPDRFMPASEGALKPGRTVHLYDGGEHRVGDNGELEDDADLDMDALRGKAFVEKTPAEIEAAKKQIPLFRALRSKGFHNTLAKAVRLASVDLAKALKGRSGRAA